MNRTPDPIHTLDRDDDWLDNEGLEALEGLDTGGLAGFGPESLDQCLQEVQAEADRTALNKYGERIVARWKELPFTGPLEDFSHAGRAVGDCGDVLDIQLLVRDGSIEDAAFVGSGCGASQVAGSMCCELAMGRTLAQAGRIDGPMILKALGGLPPDDEHCAWVAAAALKDALRLKL